MRFSHAIGSWPVRGAALLGSTAQMATMAHVSEIVPDESSILADEGSIMVLSRWIMDTLSPLVN